MHFAEFIHLKYIAWDTEFWSYNFG